MAGIRPWCSNSSAATTSSPISCQRGSRAGCSNKGWQPRTHQTEAMDFLFIHGNYPAQFRHLAALLGQNPEHRVVFLTARQDAAKDALPGVEVHTYACHRTPSAQTHHYLQASEEAVLQGQAALREVSSLVEGGLRPRVVMSHGGMGMGLFLKDLLPQALHVGYFEWYFQANTTRHLLAEFDLDAQLKTGLRNLPILQELERCDLAVVPTAWQKSQ
ncbi:MAG: hypothetical protein FJ051_05530, partial [Cyanobacteria bacterium M_surface_9_m1_291]|nr:hypothetical protein [Cyanobacteria bacterium M_surface_9_m1_291]